MKTELLTNGYVNIFEGIDEIRSCLYGSYIPQSYIINRLVTKIAVKDKYDYEQLLVFRDTYSTDILSSVFTLSRVFDKLNKRRTYMIESYTPDGSYRLFSEYYNKVRDINEINYIYDCFKDNGYFIIIDDGQLKKFETRRIGVTMSHASGNVCVIIDGKRLGGQETSYNFLQLSSVEGERSDGVFRCSNSSNKVFFSIECAKKYMINAIKDEILKEKKKICEQKEKILQIGLLSLESI